MKRFPIFLLLLIALSPLAVAQQYGHLNFANLLSELPETEAAEQQLRAFNDQLVAEGEKMAAGLQAEAEQLARDQASIAPVKFRERRDALLAKQQKLGEFEQQVELDLEKKRQELLGPLIQRLRDAVDAVAERDGYALVFNTALFNAVLFAEDSADLTAAVRAELGLE